MSVNQDRNASPIAFTENYGESIVKQCEELGISVAQVCREAKIDRTAVFRWKQGITEPRWGSYKRVQFVLESYWDRRKRVSGAMDGFWSRRDRDGRKAC